MRKSLSYKILAALMAAGSFGLYAATPAAAEDVKLTNNQLRANGNAIVIENNTLTTPSGTAIPTLSESTDVYGIGYIESEAAKFYTDTANDGNVTITGSTFDAVYGGYTIGVNGENTTANNNTVTLNNNSINYVYGGYSGFGSANENIVTIDGGNYGVIIGGWGYSGNADDSANKSANENKVSISNHATINNYIIGGLGRTANDNKVEIKDSIVNINSTFYGLIGGYATYGGASSNQISITDSKITGNVYGGYIADSTGQLAKDNNITITGSSDIENANLYGYGTNSGATGSNNTLTLNGWSGTVNSLHNFDSIIFENIDLSQNTVLTVKSADESAININSVASSTLAFAAGDYIEGSTTTLSSVSWSQALGNTVTIAKDAKDLFKNVQLDDYYFADNGSNGIFVNKVNNLSYNTNTDYQVNFTVDVTKSILTGVFIDENNDKHINTQTQDERLTIGNGFNTKVGTVAGSYAAGSKNAENGVVNISGDNISL